jgi:WD40 repeat protein
MCRLTKDNRRMISASAIRDPAVETAAALIWDLDGGSGPVVLQGHAAPVLTCAFADLGRSVVSGGEDDFVKVWDSATARQLAEYWAGAAVEAVSVQPGTGRIGVGDRTGKFHLLELLDPGARLVSPAG